MQARGSWYGVLFSPRVTMRRTCAPSVIWLAARVRYSAAVSARAIHADIQIDGLGCLEQPSKVHVEEGDPAAMYAQAFPDTVAEYEPGIKYGDEGPLARIQLAVHVDQDVAIAWVIGAVMRTLGHRNSSFSRRSGRSRVMMERRYEA